MTRLPMRLRSLTITVGLVAGLASHALAAGYPRLGLYGGINGLGYPYLLPDGTLDAAMCDSVARYDEVILDASPISEYHPEVVAALRQRHPGIQCLAYVLGNGIWYSASSDSLVHFPTRYYRLVRDLNGFLYNRVGTLYGYVGANVNLAKRDAQGRFVVAEGIADLFYDAIARTGIWDGMFLDAYCDRIAWSQSPAESIDFQRAGYPSITAFDDAWHAASDTLANRLRRLAGPGFVLVGNCGQGTKYASFNGWMRENFPYQNGGTWYSNMFRDPGGYFTDEAKFRTPRHNYIFTGAEPPNRPYSANNARKVRLGLGSATLGDGFGAFGFSSRSVGTYNYSTWWYDEYAVDLATGHSSGSLAHTGWLGQALGPAYQMIWIGSAPDASTNPDFETDVTTGWTFFGQQSTLTRDTTTAAVGSASVRVTVAVPGLFPYYTTLASTNAISVVAGASHAATFWAKTSAPRQITVAMGLPGNSMLAESVIDLTTGWHQYQVVLQPSASGSAKLAFFFAAATDTVWLDDAHLQAGVTSLWRRDFQNGAVLVNAESYPLNVPLSRPYWRIAGVVDPAVNDGAMINQITVGAQDAMFLIGQDFTPPRPVTDMQAVPR